MPGSWLKKCFNSLMQTAPISCLDDLPLALEREGFVVIESVFAAQETGILLERGISSLKEGTAGDREALSWPWVQEVARSKQIRSLVEAVLSSNAVPVRAILFDKNPSANWNLGFHQDRAVPFATKMESDGFIGWSQKNGVPHALAPAWLLERMLAVRLSLDDCDLENGPLRVLPGSHLRGLLTQEDIASHNLEDQAACVLRAGGVVLMKPLLLHASSAAQTPRHRRVLHIEYCDAALPDGLAFYAW